MYKIWRTPAGHFPTEYAEILQAPHVLVAGATGSGKSVVINGLIRTALFRCPGNVGFILIDPKRVELKAYSRLPHTLAHAAGHNPAAWEKALQLACNIMDSRYNSMAGKMYAGGDVYVIIDEFADIKKSGGKGCYNLVLRLLSEGRAARVHCIIATQIPNVQILPTELRGNIAHRIALRTANATESRIIMDAAGCENLPDYGQGFYYKPGRDNRTLYRIPYYSDEELQAMVNYWMNQRPRYSFRKPA